MHFTRGDWFEIGLELAFCVYGAAMIFKPQSFFKPTYASVDIPKAQKLRKIGMGIIAACAALIALKVARGW